jgi:chorismate mutase / prephenate dehydratase
MYATRDIATVPCRSSKAVIDTVSSGECQTGVIRFQNSEWGINLEGLNLLRESRVYMVREIIFHERYNLAGQQDAHVENLKRIYAHPAILNMCSMQMAEFKDVQIIARYDSAESLAELIQRGDATEATLCSDFAASIFGLKVIQSNLENGAKDVTRFVALAADKVPPRSEAKNIQSSVLIELKHEPGALMNALRAFSDNSINLTSVSAHPQGNATQGYLMFLEFAGSFEDDPVRTALAQLRDHTIYLQLLGSYNTVEPVTT